MALPCERCVSGPTTVAWTTSRGVAPLPRNAVLPAATLSAGRFSLIGRCVHCRGSKFLQWAGSSTILVSFQIVQKQRWIALATHFDCLTTPKRIVDYSKDIYQSF
jgi:hypothetical protein